MDELREKRSCPYHDPCRSDDYCDDCDEAPHLSCILAHDGVYRCETYDPAARSGTDVTSEEELEEELEEEFDDDRKKK